MGEILFEDGCINPAIAARKLGISAVQVRNLCRDGKLKARQMIVPGHQPLWSIHINDLVEFLPKSIIKNLEEREEITKRINRQKTEYKIQTGLEFGGR